MKSLFHISLLLVLCHCYAYAQNDSDKEDNIIAKHNLDTLKSIYVTASKLDTKVTTSGKSVTVITADEIKDTPANSIDEIIKWTVGVNVNTRQPYGVQADIGIRGSTYSQVLLLIDGIRQNDPLTSHFNSNIPINKTNIDRIEIIKGAAAAAYGADAVAGVIHIKTKTFLSKPNAPNKTTLDSELSAGRDGLRIADIGIIDKNNKLHQAISIKIANADGEAFENPAYNKENVPANSQFYNNNFSITTISLSNAYHINDKYKVFFRLGYDNRDIGAKYFYTNSIYDESQEKMNLVHTQFAITQETEKKKLILNIGHRTMHDIFIFNPQLPPFNTHRMLLTVAALDYTIRYSSNFSILMGTQSYFKNIRSNDRGDQKDYTTSAYFNFRIKPIENAYVNGSTRLNYDSNYGIAPIYQLNIAYLLNQYMTLRAGAGNAIRAADYTERYVSYKIPNLSPGRNIGNPDLTAETTNSYDIGIEIKLKKTDIGISWYQRFGTNIIDFVTENQSNITNISTLQQGKDYFYAKNIEDVNSSGVEVMVSNIVYKSVKTLIKARLGYTYMDTKYSTEEKSKNLYHPRHIFNFMTITKSSRVSLQLYYNYFVRDTLDSIAVKGKLPEQYGVLDARISCDIISQLSLFVQANNLLDTSYQEVLGASMPSRWVSYGISWNLSR